MTPPVTAPVVLGVGAELKSTVCLATENQAGLSVHLGDLENPATLAAFESTIADLLGLANVVPHLIVHDLHPEYLSTKFAQAQDMAPTLAVQHHHAHLVSCLTENGHEGPAIGVSFDGLGWGADGSAWGGEFLVGDASRYVRAAHLKTVPMPGGVAAIRDPWRMTVSHLNAAGIGMTDLPFLESRGADVDDVLTIGAHANTMQTSSIGRLFDAVAALCGVASSVRYEGQAAIGLEQLAGGAPPTSEAYEFESGAGDPHIIDPSPVVREAVADVRNGVNPAIIARRFHQGVAAMIAKTCAALRDETRLDTVALTGGVFQNRLLVELTLPRLEAVGFDVLRHAHVPPNDGGISLGQVAVGRAWALEHALK